VNDAQEAHHVAIVLAGVNGGVVGHDVRFQLHTLKLAQEVNGPLPLRALPVEKCDQMEYT